MISLRLHCPRPILSAALFLVCGFGASAGQAGPVYLFMVVDPATTAGAGVPSSDGFSVTSNRSGAGTWHLYAVDDLSDSYGIRSFFVKLDGTITSLCSRSPMAQYADGTGLGTGAPNVGFNDVRSTTPYIGAGQSVFNNTQIGGLGISASNFNLKTSGQPLSATTNGQWGNYADPFTSGSLGNTGETRNALFLAEGTYTGSAPTIDLTTPLSDGGTGVNYWADAGLTRSATAPLLSSSNPFACPDCVNGHDPFLVKSKIAADPVPQPGPAVLPTPPKPPVADPEPVAGVPFEPPVATSDPQIPPAAADDPQPEIQPHGEYPQSIETVYYNNIWVSLPIGEPISGVEHDGLIYYTYQTIDSAASVTPTEIVPTPCHGGLQCAMKTALAGLHASEVLVGDGLNQIHAVPNLLAASLIASGADLTDRVSFESAVAAPEPATLALVGLASIGLAGMVCRRRSQ